MNGQIPFFYNYNVHLHCFSEMKRKFYTYSAFLFLLLAGYISTQNFLNQFPVRKSVFDVNFCFEIDDQTEDSEVDDFSNYFFHSHLLNSICFTHKYKRNKPYNDHLVGSYAGSHFYLFYNDIPPPLMAWTVQTFMGNEFISQEVGWFHSVMNSVKLYTGLTFSKRFSYCMHYWWIIPPV